MPAVLSMVGFGAQDPDRDRLTISAGTLTYDTVNLPGASSSNVSAGGNSVKFRKTWHDDPNIDVYEPSTGEFWFHMRYYTALNNTNNDLLRIGVGSSLAEFITLSAQDNTNLITIRVAGTVRATAVSAAFSSGLWSRLHVYVSGVEEGDTINVYTDGSLTTPVLSYTLTATDYTNLVAVGTGQANCWYIEMKSGDSASRVDDLVAWDPQHSDFPGISYFQSCSLKEEVFTGNGAEQDWAGDYNDIDDVPYNDTDKITASAVDDDSAFTTDAIAEPNVFAVRVLARVTRTGTDAGSNLTLTMGNSGGVGGGATVPAPGDGDVEYIHQRYGDGTAWSPTKRDDTRFLFRAET